MAAIPGREWNADERAERARGGARFAACLAFIALLGAVSALGLLLK